MFKRLFTLVLIAVMMITAIPNVSGASVADDYINNKENIYNLWGDFETPEQIAHITTSGIDDPNKGAYKSTELIHAKGGAEESARSIQVNMTSAESDDYINFHFPAVPYERYDLSFWLKTDEPDVESIIMKMCFFGYSTIDDIEIPIASHDGKWHKYEITWDCRDSATEYNNGEGGAANIRFALKGPTDAYSFCIDRISAMPYGYVDYWEGYESVNTHYRYATGTLPPEPTYGNADTNPFSDIKTHWARETIRGLYAAGMVSGMGDGTFAPDDNVTRAEFVKMALGLFNEKESKYDGEYEDVAVDSWYASFVAKADDLGLIAPEMKMNEKFFPETSITREEAATIIAKVAENNGAKAGKTMNFADKDRISAWAKDSINKASAFGIINGYEDNTFKPQGNITRAEAAEMLYKVAELKDRIGIFVDAELGNDKNDGTKKAPLKTLEAARDMAMKYSDKMKHDLFIFIRGEHYFEKTFELDERHSGKNGHDIVYTSWGVDKPVFTMSKYYTGFEIHDEEKNIWKVKIGDGEYSRDAYFNDVRGIRARQVGYLKNWEFVDKKYYLCDNRELLDLKYPQEAEAIFHVHWTNNKYRIESITEQNGRIRIDLVPYVHGQNYRIVTSYSDRHPRIYTPSYLENAYEFLDATGEWYLDKHEGYVYYIPRPGEDMSAMELKLPLGEKLIEAKGSTYSSKLTNVTFDNIQFEGTSWFRIEEKGGFAPIQNSLLTGTRENGNEGRTGESIGAAVRFEKSENITLTNNKFRHMGLTCLELLYGAKYITIEGNEFADTSSHALLIDDASVNGWFKTKAKETWCEYLNINNNYFHHCAMTEHGSATVGIGFTRHMKFTHNIILYSVYSGISSGWGWNTYNNTGSINYNNEYSHNLFQDIMYGRVNDGAALYNLGSGSRELDSIASAPNKGLNKNRVINNYFLNIWDCDSFYTDSGSVNFYVANNVTDKGKNVKYGFNNYTYVDKDYPEYFHWHHAHSNTMFYQTFENNYSTVDYAYHSGYMNAGASSYEPTKMYPERDWPDEALAIMDEAGIEEKYRDNFDLDGDKVFMANNRWEKMRVGDSIDPGLLLYGIRGVDGDISDYDIRWSFADPEALKYENGRIVALKPGIQEAEVRAVVDGIEMSHHFLFECYDTIDDIRFRYDTINMLAGSSERTLDVIMEICGENKFVSREVGKKLIADVKMEDPSIATIAYDEESHIYKINGVSRGKTRILATFTYEGQIFTEEIPVNVITYGTEEAATLPFEKIDLTKNWNTEGSSSNGGLALAGLPVHWLGGEIDNKLVAFDMEINAGNNWPSLAICESRTDGNYTLADCYMIGFRSDMIELQRWKNGQRIYIFGAASGNPIGGAGVPYTGDNKFEYNKRVSVVVGALEHEEGTRIVLNINGKNIIDYIDNSESKLEPKGHFGMYNPWPGATTFYPYTGITNE